MTFGIPSSPPSRSHRVVLPTAMFSPIQPPPTVKIPFLSTDRTPWSSHRGFFVLEVAVVVHVLGVEARRRNADAELRFDEAPTPCRVPG